MTREEFEQLVTDTGPQVYAFCLQLARNRDEAEELYQETMLAATERRRRIDLQNNPKSYLLGIAVGLWKNLRRKLARRNRIHPQTSLDAQLEEIYPADEEPALEETVVEKIAEQEQARLVRRAVEGLPERLRLPVYLYYSRELSVEDIASVLHIPKGTVKSRLHKARTVIRDRMEAEGYAFEERGPIQSGNGSHTEPRPDTAYRTGC